MNPPAQTPSMNIARGGSRALTTPTAWIWAATCRGEYASISNTAMGHLVASDSKRLQHHEIDQDAEDILNHRRDGAAAVGRVDSAAREQPGQPDPDRGCDAAGDKDRNRNARRQPHV